jgi:hypothetical protein
VQILETVAASAAAASFRRTIMTIKMLAGIAGVDFSLSPGDETGRFSAKEEERLIAAGLAARLAVSKVEKAVKPTAPETR